MVTVLAARWIVRRQTGCPLGAGLIALGFLLTAEIGITVGLRRLSLSDYIASRDPVSGTVYLILLAAFAVMPFLVSPKRREKTALGAPALLDPFIPNPDVRERHQVLIHAPAALVFEIAYTFDLQSIAIVRGIFWLRAKLLGAETAAWHTQGFIADMLALGWERLAEEPDRYFIAGAACQPWKAEVTFSPIPPGEFATFTEPDRVKIAWTLEAEALTPTATRFATETRVVATDASARAKFGRYWRKFAIGIVIIRRLLLSTVRQKAERQWKVSSR